MVDIWGRNQNVKFSKLSGARCFAQKKEISSKDSKEGTRDTIRRSKSTPKGEDEPPTFHRQL